MHFRYLFLLLIGFETVIGQSLPVVWEQKMSPGATKIKMHSMDDALFIGSGEKFITAFHASDGSIAWNYKFEEKFGIKSFEWQEWNRENGVILLGNSDDNSIKIFIDDKTGNELWRTDKLSEFKKYAFNESFTNCFVNELHAFPIIGGAEIEMVDVRTGKAIWTNDSILTGQEKELALTYDGHKLAIRHQNGNYKPRIDYVDAMTGKKIEFVSIELSFIKGYRYQVMDEEVMVGDKPAFIEIRYTDEPNSAKGDERSIVTRAIEKNSGQVLWSTEFKSKIVGALVGTNDFIDFKIQSNVVLVITKDMTAFDVTTGAKLWQIPFSSSDTRSFPKKALYLDLSAYETDESFVYLADITSVSVRKLDLLTGKTVWQYKFQNPRADKTFSKFLHVGDLLIVPSGGRFPYQAEVKSSMPLYGVPIGGVGGIIFSAGIGINRTSLYNKKEFQGDENGVYAIDRNSGQLKWSAPMERLTNILLYDNLLYAGDKKKVYCFEPESGKQVFSIDLSKSKIGNLYEIAVDSANGRISVRGEDGMAALNPKDGSIVYATNTGDNYMCLEQGNQWFVATDANDEMNIEEIVGFDMNTGKVGLKYSVRNPTIELTDFMSIDGQFIFEYALSKARKYKITP